MKNKTRTLVTLIGIILSVSMFTATVEAFYSAQQYLIDVTAAEEGLYHAQYKDLDRETAEKLKNDDEYEKVVTLQNIGFAEVKSENDFKPYLFIAGMSEGFTELVGVRVTEGRLPENGSEIVVSKHAITNGKFDIKLGDKLDLSVGSRKVESGSKPRMISFNEELHTDDRTGKSIEKLVDCAEKCYTVVGFCERPDYKLERFEDAGYTAFTLAEKDSGQSYRAFFTVKDPIGFFENSNTEYGEILYKNGTILALTFQSRADPIILVAIGLGIILLAIIVIGSIALIYNSFSISVSERTKQYGLLRSVGATKKQIMASVRREALILCLVAIPLGLVSGCLGLAVTFRLLDSDFSAIISSVGESDGIRMHLYLNPIALAFSALLSIFTVLLSARIPAKRAMKLAPIEAIRQSGDISVKSSNYKVSGLSSKLFGFSGILASKNFKRNRKKYRTTVFSLVLSLVLFISASSLSFYFTKSFELASLTTHFDISTFAADDSLSDEKAEAVMKELSELEGVKESATLCGNDDITESIVLDRSVLSDEAISSVYENRKSSYFEWNGNFDSSLRFVDDSYFKKLLKDNGLSENGYFDTHAPKGLLYDSVTILEVNEKGKESYRNFKLFKEQKDPFDLKAYRLVPPEGFVFGFSIDDKDNASFTKLDSEEEAVFPVKEYLHEIDFRVGSEIKEAPMFLYNAANAVVLIYPTSMMPYVGINMTEKQYYYGYYRVTDHAAVVAEMKKISETYGNAVIVEDELENDATYFSISKIVKVFSYGFIALISLIAAANVFNTINTNLMLRRRELAMLKSVGMSDKAMMKMMRFESWIYGLKSLLFGLPVSVAMMLIIYYVMSGSGFDMPFSAPWGNIVFAILSVFAVVFASMIYSMNKIKKSNTSDALKDENT